MPESESSRMLPTIELTPATSVTDAVARLHRGTHHVGNLRLRRWKITLSSYAALRVMADRPNLTLAQLSRRCFVRPQTMTRMVTQLVGRGLVERQTRPDDVRALSLRLTRGGESLLSEMGAEVNRIEHSFTSALTEQEIVQLDELLRRCARQVEADIKQEFPAEAF